MYQIRYRPASERNKTRHELAWETHLGDYPNQFTTRAEAVEAAAALKEVWEVDGNELEFEIVEL